MARRIVLARYPQGAPIAEDFAVETFDPVEPDEGELLVAVSHLSMDPFPRLRMNERSAAGRPMRLGATVEGRGVGRVLRSRAPGWSAGDWLIGEPGWQSVACLAADRCEKIDYAAGSPSLHLGALGPSGLTAYFTTVALGGLREGETLAFTPAAGSVGSIAGQIARILGARTVGIASTGQLAALSGFGYDAGVALDGLADLGAACPDGIDLFIDGVGGAVHEGILPRVNLRARIVLLGFIAAYNEVGPPRYGNAASVLMKRARMEGFLLADWRDRFDEARTALSGWIAEGRLRNVETVWPGLEAAPAAFAALFGEALPGKQIVTIEENLS